MPNPLQLWVTIPAKPLIEGKSRLASALSGQDRCAFTRQLLARTLGVVLSVEDVAGVVVVSRDPEALALAETMGAIALGEAESNGEAGRSGQERGLNRAIAQAAAFVQEQKAEALLFVPTDLPLLQVADIQMVLRVWAQRRNSIVIAPSQTGGTNALLLAPPDGIPPAFGLDSFARHRKLAQQRGLHVEVVESSSLAWDVDTPEEYRLWAACL